MKGVFLLYFLISIYSLQAQEYKGYTPLTYSYKQRYSTKTKLLKALDLQKIYKEDSIQFVEHQQFNIARLQKIDLGIISKSNLQKLGKDKSLWQYIFKLPKSKAIAIKFRQLYLPKGSRFFLYTTDQKDEFLVFDASKSSYQLSNFISEKVYGETLILEYNQMINSSDSLIIEIDGLVNFYKRDLESNPGFGQSTDCEVNIACSEGDGWCNEAQSVLRIFIQSGSTYSYCTGAVVNNTKQDFSPYVLTAEHCGTYATEEDFAFWKFDFNYQSDACSSPSSESEILSNRIYGCQQLAKARRELTSGSDFRLLKLMDSIPKAWNIYYAGWDIEDYSSISNGGVGIHHPYGDIKKISTYIEDLESTDAHGGNVNDDYWKTSWIETENGYGITEGGSSGSPLFNSKGLIIGTLSTGSSYCDNRKNSPDYYGKMSRHWDKNGTSPSEQLKPWLDPLNLGVKQLGGKAGNKDLECGEKISFDNFILFPNPANTVLRVGNDNLEYLSDAIFELYDINGKKIKTIKTNSSVEVKKIDISHLPDGVYVLKVIQTAWVIQQKFVILR